MKRFTKFICVRQNGTTFPAEIRTKVATYGERVVQIASIYDISDCKRAEEASLLDERTAWHAKFMIFSRKPLQAFCHMWERRWKSW
jgi:hypothetical protein